MLRWRLFGAFTILIPFFTVLYLDDQWNAGRPGIWIGSLALVVALLAADEVNRLIGKAGLPTSPTANIWGVFCVMAFTIVPLLMNDYPVDCPVGKPGWTLIGLAVAVACLFANELYRYRVPGDSIVRLAGGSLVVIYVGVMLSFLVQLRMMLPGRTGLMAVVATLLIVKLSDTGAFFVGRSYGRTHFTMVSPKKTVAGVVGGVVFAVIAAGLIRDWLLPRFDPSRPRGGLVAYLAYGACLALAGLLGDLSESLLKRDVHQKDSSPWLRGLGGVLDVIDSLLTAGPVSFLWWSTGWL